MSPFWCAIIKLSWFLILLILWRPPASRQSTRLSTSTPDVAKLVNRLATNQACTNAYTFKTGQQVHTNASDMLALHQQMLVEKNQGDIVEMVRTFIDVSPLLILVFPSHLSGTWRGSTSFLNSLRSWSMVLFDRILTSRLMDIVSPWHCLRTMITLDFYNCPLWYF